MRSIERLLEPGCQDLPECRCGSLMQVVRDDAKAPDVLIRIFQCQTCDHEMRLTLWAQAELENAAP